jgi:hypothetical protein
MYHQGPTVGFFYKINDLFGDYEFSSLDFMLHVPALLAYGKTRSLAKPRRMAQRPNSGLRIDTQPWSCPDCGSYNNHILCLGMCSYCGYVRNDIDLYNYDGRKVQEALRLFKKWVGIIAPHRRLESEQLRALDPPSSPELEPSDEFWKKMCDGWNEEPLEQPTLPDLSSFHFCWGLDFPASPPSGSSNESMDGLEPTSY